MDEQNQEKKRAAVYVDGFNLYHAIHDLGEPFLKWNCIWNLGEIFAHKGGYDLVRVTFCTAFPTHKDHGTKDRFRAYTNALKARGVNVIEGHYLEERTTGQWKEKQSDVNLALSCISDAYNGVFDAAYLVTADSDQAATARVFRDEFPEKRLIPVAPPKKPIPKKTQSFSERGFVISKDMIEACVMSGFVPGKSGGLIRRPAEYDPPDWWVHPDARD